MKAAKAILYAAILLFVLGEKNVQAEQSVTELTYNNQLYNNNTEQTQIELLLQSNLAFINGSKNLINAENNRLTPYLEQNTTFIPLRFVSGALHAKVIWNPILQEVHVSLREKTIRYRIGENAKLIDSVTFVPLRQLAEFFGEKVTYTEGYIVVGEGKAQHRDELQAGLPYLVYQNDTLLGGYRSQYEAEQYAVKWANASVRDRGGQWVWDNYPPFRIYQYENRFAYFDSFADAVAHAKKFADSSVRLKNGTKVWESKTPVSHRIKGVPLVLQKPELPRGCEVSALAMVLQFYGADVDKMTLAKEVKKDLTPYRVIDGEIYYGNPYDGFVGDMYTFSKPGFGVYHGPIKKLAESYMPGKAINMTGSNLDDVLYTVSKGNPVWVIHNVMFNEVPDRYWQTWHTPSGDLAITYKEHSVVITGFDDDYIYINDPLGITTKVSRSPFEKGWNQMGKQAIAIIP